MTWTASDIPDQTGRTVVVTGANSGLGEECTLAFAAAGANVVMACRNQETGAAVAAKAGPNAHVEKLDLADLGSIRDFAGRVGPVDVLINNAGIMAPPLHRTADGFELQFGTNHLGHFALTGLLLDRIADRVVTVSSFGHRFGRVSISDPNYERRGYERWTAYGQSKLANLLFAFELDRRLRAEHSPVHSLAAHPGFASTGLMSHTESFQDAVMGIGTRIAAQSAADGALPILYAATAGDALGGEYFGPRALFGLRGAPGRASSSDAARDEKAARELWAMSERLTGVRYLD